MSASDSKRTNYLSAEKTSLAALVLTWTSSSDETQTPHTWPLLLTLNPGSKLALQESTHRIGHLVKGRQRTQRMKTSEEI